MAHANHSNDGKRTGNFLNAIPILLLIAAGLLAVLWAKSYFWDESKETSRVVSTAPTSTQGAEASASAPLQQQSTCPPFSQEGATCEVTTACSGWIRQAPGLPAGLTHYFTPHPDRPEVPESDRIWRSIRYMDQYGRISELVHGESGTDIVAWNFCPRRTVVMTYHAS